MKLSAYLRREKLNPAQFARLHQLPRATVYRLVKELFRIPNGDTCRRIIEATGGSVTLRDLTPASRLRPSNRRGVKR